jgi:hypothetical protein
MMRAHGRIYQRCLFLATNDRDFDGQARRPPHGARHAERDGRAPVSGCRPQPGQPAVVQLAESLRAAACGSRRHAKLAGQAFGQPTPQVDEPSPASGQPRARLTCFRAPAAGRGHEASGWLSWRSLGSRQAVVRRGPSGTLAPRRRPGPTALHSNAAGGLRTKKGDSGGVRPTEGKSATWLPSNSTLSGHLVWRVRQ